MRPFDLLEKIYTWPEPVARAVMGAALPRIIPVTRGMGIKVIELRRERVVTTMPLNRRTRNHVGSVYLGNQTVGAEITMALRAFRSCPPPRFRLLINKVEGDFVAQAKHGVRIVCEPTDDEQAALDALAEMAPGKAEAWLTSSVRDLIDDEEVARLRFRLAIKRYEDR